MRFMRLQDSIRCPRCRNRWARCVDAHGLLCYRAVCGHWTKPVQDTAIDQFVLDGLIDLGVLDRGATIDALTTAGLTVEVHVGLTPESLALIAFP